jgi:capsule polysaccharide export protein KpsC/LpsZ
VFSHVLWDANMFFGRDLFSDQEQWFVETVRAACANDRVNWIVKLHPANVWKRKRDGVVGELDEHVAIREQIGELPSHVSLLEPDTEISTWSLFDVTDCGVTIRGSVGFELPAFGKTALTAGTGFYAGRGFTVDSDTAPEYLGRLASIQDLPPPTPEQVELAKKHAYALFRLRQTRFSTFRSVHKPIERIDDPSEATIEIRVSSAEELANAADLRRLGDWAVDSADLDYLEL